MKKIWQNLLYNLRSMRMQVFGILVCMGLIPVIFLFNIISDSYRSQLISQRKDELQSYGTVISNLVTSSGYLLGQTSSDVDSEA